MSGVYSVSKNLAKGELFRNAELSEETQKAI